MRWAAPAAAFLLLFAAAPALAAPTPTVTTTPPKLTGFTAPPKVKPALTEAKVKKIFFAVPKVKDWVGRYPKKTLVTQVTYDKTYRVWDVGVWSEPAGEIASGRIDDLSSKPTAWTGPQVAWTMAISPAFPDQTFTSQTR